VEFLPKKSSYHHDESVLVKNPEVVRQISSLLRVTEETLTAALTSKRARVSGEMLVINYRMPEVCERSLRNLEVRCFNRDFFFGEVPNIWGEHLLMFMRWTGVECV